MEKDIIFTTWCTTFILFDFGGPHCVILSAFISLHDNPRDILTFSWIINIDNMNIISSRICPIVMCRRKFDVNFLIIDSDGFNIIHGIDWLSTFYAIVDYKNKSIIFQVPNHREFKFLGAARHQNQQNSKLDLHVKSILQWIQKMQPFQWCQNILIYLQISLSNTLLRVEQNFLLIVFLVRHLYKKHTE